MCQSLSKTTCNCTFLDTGGFAQAFFSEKKRQAVVDLFEFDNDIDEDGDNKWYWASFYPDT